MTRALTAAVCLLSLAACANTGTPYLKARPPIDLCQGAGIRRTVYVATIAGTDAYAASGRAMPTAMALGREAAVIALSVLDLNCPTAPIPAR